MYGQYVQETTDDLVSDHSIWLYHDGCLAIWIKGQPQR